MQALVLLLTIFVTYIVSWTIYARFLHPYCHIPGPFFASLTRFWLVRCVLGGKAEEVTRKLHDRYGPVVRIAPDEVSISDPEAISTIYGVKSSFAKTDFFEGFGTAITPNGNLFTMRDEKFHTERRRIVNSMYTLSSILEQEKYIDTCLELFHQRMTEFVESGEILDLGRWLWNYTFDVIGEIFFGKHFGFMEKAEDHGGWMEMMENLIPLMVTTAVLPKYLRSAVMMGGLVSPAIRKGIPGFGNLHKAAVDCVARKQDQMRHEEPIRQDNLTKAFAMYREDLHDEKKLDHQKVLFEDVQNEAFTAIGAGSETTAIALSAIIYKLLTHPRAYEKLLAEINAADEEGRLGRPFVRYSEASKLPYLTACCKEGMRMHPSIALTFPRQIPSDCHGLEIAGVSLPAGGKVGISPAVVQFNTDVFGEDVYDFRPERWLRSKDAARMDRHMMIFGAGKRTCIGINIALVEMYKLIPQFLRDFNVELANPGKKLKTRNIWFWRQYGLDVKLSKRNEQKNPGR